MDAILEQDLRRGISSKLVQLNLGKMSRESFYCFVAGANSAMRVVDMHYSIDKQALCEGSVDDDNAECADEDAFNAGYASVAKAIADNAGV